MATPGKPSVLDLLGEQSLGNKIALLLMVLLVLGGAYYMLVFSGLSDERDSATNRHRSLAREHQKLVKREQEYLDMMRRIEEIRQLITDNAVALPMKAELPAFLAHMQEQAARAGVNVKKWDPGKQETLGRFVKVSWSVEVEGTFYQINHFFKLLSETQRIIMVENLTMGDARLEPDRVVLEAAFTAATFRHTPESAKQFQAAQALKKAGKSAPEATP